MSHRPLSFYSSLSEYLNSRFQHQQSGRLIPHWPRISVGSGRELCHIKFPVEGRVVDQSRHLWCLTMKQLMNYWDPILVINQISKLAKLALVIWLKEVSRTFGVTVVGIINSPYVPFYNLVVTYLQFNNVITNKVCTQNWAANPFDFFHPTPPAHTLGCFRF